MPATLTINGVVRLRSAPACDPPYDDERPPEWWGSGPVQPLLELPATPVAERDSHRRAWRPTLAGVAGGLAEPQPGASPATIAAATRFVNTCLEILNGYRPVGHVRVLAHPLAAQAALSEMSQAVRRLRRTARGGGQLVKLRTMRTCEPRPRVAEIAVVLGSSWEGGGGRDRRGRAEGRDGQETWAFAFRLEQLHGRWLCTAATLL